MIGERLAKARKTAGLTQQDLADYLNVTYKAISQYERDIHAPSVKNMKLIAKKLNISLDYLMGATDEKISLDRSNKFVLSDNFPEKAKTELREYSELLILKYKKK